MTHHASFPRSDRKMVAEWIPEGALGFPAGYAVSGIPRGFLWLLRDDSSIGQLNEEASIELDRPDGVRRSGWRRSTIARFQVIEPELIYLARYSGERVFPAGLHLVDGAVIVGAERIREAADCTSLRPFRTARWITVEASLTFSSSDRPEGLLSLSISARFSASAAAVRRTCSSAFSASLMAACFWISLCGSQEIVDFDRRGSSS
jgi:hypothetical protein